MQMIPIPFFAAQVQAGFPSPAADYLEERIDLNKVFIKNPVSTFIINSTGDSMINAFIPPKAKLIIDRSISASNGDIVLAMLNGEFTVKFLRKNDFKCWLVPANSKFREIEITPGMELEIWGVVTAIFVDPKDVRRCML
jgi:DNA polymerase V